MSEATLETLLEFPCFFPIKAMGRNIPNLESEIFDIVRKHANEVTIDAVRTRFSKGGKFISITVDLEAQSQQQLEAIYSELNASPHIVMTL